MKVKFLTLYPEIFPGFLGHSVTGKALGDGKWSFETVNIRDYAFDKYGSVDDTPCGGGAGMVMRPDVLGAAIKANYTSGRLIYMSPRGIPLNQAKAHELANEENLTIICGRFEGIDERVLEAYNVEEISIYTITGVMVGQQTTDNGQQSLSINISNLNAGVYFIKVNTEDGEVVKRFIKN